MPLTSTPSTADDAELDRRITFHDDIQTMEVDFSDFHFGGSEIVNRFYDRLEARIDATGEPQWFFMINLNGTRIDPAAWIAYSRRGRALNLAHSMGSVRYDASEETRQQIIRAANTEAFDPNLFADRKAALARIAELPNTRRRKQNLEPSHTLTDFVRRVRFDDESGIMHVDFSHFTLNHSRDVDDVYDYLEERLKETGRKWFFLVDMNGCQIMPGAWIRYAFRGKALNIAYSLGSVRYAADSESEADIRLRAESQGFRPNIRNTRAEALELIEELRAGLPED
nr:hypothetical protein [uncultured Roseovarius sp.]